MLSAIFRGAGDSLIEVITARKIMFVKRATKIAFAVSTGNAQNGGLSNKMFVADLGEEIDGSFSANDSLSRDFAKTTDENAFKKGAVHCIPATLNELEQKKRKYRKTCRTA